MTRISSLLFVLLSYISSIDSTLYQCNSTASCGCATSATTVTARIVGGEAAPDHAWGWIVSLQRYGSHRCGASLITDEYAVTAAHCVYGFSATDSILSILAGTNYLTGTSAGNIQRRTIDKIYIHPSYDDSAFTNDIALIHFTSLSTSSGSNLAFICLPTYDQDPFTNNADLVAIGWGVTNESSSLPSNYLQQVTVNAISSTSADCQRVPIVNATVQFCADVSGGGKDTCQGDSGGPLMAFSDNRWVLAGITSSGIGCARPGYAGIYTRVSHFIPFIEATLDSTGETTPIISTTLSTSVINTHASTLGHSAAMVMSRSTIVVMFWLISHLSFAF